MSNSTRKYLRNITQEGEHRMPDGPLLMSPDQLGPSFHREVIMRMPHVTFVELNWYSCLRSKHYRESKVYS